MTGSRPFYDIKAREKEMTTNRRGNVCRVNQVRVWKLQRREERKQMMDKHVASRTKCQVQNTYQHGRGYDRTVEEHVHLYSL